MVKAASSYPQSNTLLFSLCQERGVLSALVVAQVLAFIISLSYLGEGFWQWLGQVTLLVQFIAAASLAALFALSRLPFVLGQKTQIVLVVVIVVLTTAMTSLYVAQLSLFYSQHPYVFAFKNSLIALLVIALFVQFMAIHHEQAKVHSAFARAELDALQARIRPHFLFNTLNTIAELTYHDAKAAEESTLALASLSRAAMNVGQSSTLHDELELAKRYIKLEQWRFGERLSVNWQLPAHLPNVNLPCLTLQPLLENAVFYGVESNPAGGQINVEVVFSQQSVVVVVQNPIAGTKPEQKKRKNNGIALDNIAKRLAIIFAGKASLNGREIDNAYRVKLVIPRTGEVKVNEDTHS